MQQSTERPASQSPSEILTVEIHAGVSGFGFAIGGGVDTSIPVHFVKRISEGNPADVAGLKLYDSIFEINGVPIPGLTNAETLNIVKSSKTCILKVRRMAENPSNILPLDPNLSGSSIAPSPAVFGAQSTPSPNLSQTPVVPMPADAPGVVVAPVAPAPPTRSFFTVNIDKGADGLGIVFTTTTDPATSFALLSVKSIKSGSRAEASGIAVGDRVHAVNDQSFERLSGAESINILKAVTGVVKFLFSREGAVPEEPVPQAALNVPAETAAHAANRISTQSFDLPLQAPIKQAPPVPTAPLPSQPVEVPADSKAVVTATNEQNFNVPPSMPPPPPPPPADAQRDSDDDDDDDDDDVNLPDASPPSVPPPLPATAAPALLAMSPRGSLKLPSLQDTPKV
jgi:protein scribble